MSETLTLDYPIEANGVTVSTLSLRRPTVGDLIASRRGNRSDQEAEIHLLADLCGVSPEDIQRLDLSDYFALQALLGKMQGLGKSSSAKV